MTWRTDPTDERVNVIRCHAPSGTKYPRDRMYVIQLRRASSRRQIIRMYRDLRADGCDRHSARYHVINAAMVLQ